VEQLQPELLPFPQKQRWTTIFSSWKTPQFEVVALCFSTAAWVLPEGITS
jgi:hypothetical protein